MPKPIEEVVVTKLDRILRVLAISVTNGLKQTEQIALLNRAGIPPKDIADLLGTTPNTVSVALAKRKAARDVRSRKGRSSAS